MNIKLSPVAGTASRLVGFKQGDMLALNGLTFDLGGVTEGATLPASALNSPWFAGPVERIDGRLWLCVVLPNRDDASEAERFPADLLSVPDGQLALPGPEVDEQFPALGFAAIDWSALITAEMKLEQEAAVVLADAQANLRDYRETADSAIAPLQDAVDLEDATDGEVAALKDWKRYRLALNRLQSQPGWPTDIDWPAPPV